MTAPFDEAAARKLLGAWPEVPGLDDLVAAFVEARAAVEACNREPVAWQFRWRRLDRVGGWSHWAEAAGGPEQIAFLQTSPEHEVRPLYTAPQPTSVDAVGIVERMREKWNYSRKFYCGPIDCNRQYAEARYSAFIEAADEILDALRGESR